MPLTKHERLQLIFDRLKAAETPKSTSVALDLISWVVTDVENQHSGIAAVPNPDLEFAGRMYGPNTDNIKILPEGLRARTRGNVIYVWNDGSFVIMTLTGVVVVANLHEGVTK